MIFSKKAETLVGIIISVVILSICLLGVLQVLNFSSEISNKNDDDVELIIVQKNAEVLGEVVNLESIGVGNKFYIGKAPTGYRAVPATTTDTSLQIYKFVDGLGNQVVNGKFTRVYTKLANEGTTAGNNFSLNKNNFSVKIEKNIP